MSKTTDKIIVGVFSIVALIALEAGLFIFTGAILDIANEWWEPYPTPSEILQGMVNLHLNCGILIVFGVTALFAGARVIKAFEAVFPELFDTKDHKAGRDVE